MALKYKIVFGGKAKSGKDTASRMLVGHLGLRDDEVDIWAIAQPMKEIIMKMCPDASRQCLFGPSELRSNVISEDLLDEMGKPLTYRQALLDLGKLGRRYNPDFWIRCLVKNIEASQDKTACLISDQRFSNEFEYLKKAGFFMIRMQRKNITKIDDISETEQDRIPNDAYDAVIQNDDSIEKLSARVKEIADRLKQ